MIAIQMLPKDKNHCFSVKNIKIRSKKMCANRKKLEWGRETILEQIYRKASIILRNGLRKSALRGSEPNVQFWTKSKCCGGLLLYNCRYIFSHWLDILCIIWHKYNLLLQSYLTWLLVSSLCFSLDLRVVSAFSLLSEKSGCCALRANLAVLLLTRKKIRNHIKDRSRRRGHYQTLLRFNYSLETAIKALMPMGSKHNFNIKLELRNQWLHSQLCLRFSVNITI
jgi:hypothetical protein